MITYSTFYMALIGTMGLTALVVRVMWKTLFDLLSDVCGTATRAQFWRNYTAIIVFLVPLAAVMIGRSDDRAGTVTFIDQFCWGVLGLILSLIVVAIVLVSNLSQSRVPGRMSYSARNEDIRRLLRKIETAEWGPDEMDQLIHAIDEIRARHVMQHTEKSNGS